MLIELTIHLQIQDVVVMSALLRAFQVFPRLAGGR